MHLEATVDDVLVHEHKEWQALEWLCCNSWLIFWQQEKPVTTSSHTSQQARVAAVLVLLH
jgi:hypothetical protein